MSKSVSKTHIVWMALRNLVPRSGFGLSLMTTISIAGVAAGVFILIVVLSVMGGFEESLRNKMLGSEPHLEIFAENAAAGFSLKKYSLEDIAALVPENTAIQAFTRADVVLKHRKHLQSAELYGVDGTETEQLFAFTRSITDGSLAGVEQEHTPIITEDGEGHEWPGIVLGENLAGNLGVDVGDEILIINPQGATDANAALAGATTVRHYVLVGTFRTGDVKYDAKVAVVSLVQGRRFMPDYAPFLDTEQYVTGVGLNLADPYAVDNVGEQLKGLKGLKPVSWQMANKSLLFALKLEKFVMGFILMFIVLVAAFSISGTMMMTVFHKRRQVSLLRALGMTRSGIAQLYMLHGFAIGTVGMSVGFLLGLGVCFYISQAENLLLPSGIYYQNRLPVKFIPGTYVVICALAWLFSIGASIFPAFTAASQNPSEGLRYE